MRPSPEILITQMPNISGEEIGLCLAQKSNCGVLFVTAADIEQDYFKDWYPTFAQGGSCMALPMPFDN